jgi:putative ABC transport system permease protein
MRLRLALRSLAKNPAFTAFAVAILALGIGANTAIFSVVSAVLLRPLAYQHPERIVTIRNAWKDGRTPLLMSAPDFHDYHDQSNVFSAMSIYNSEQVSVVVGHSGAYERVGAVSPEFFRVFEISALKGRLFTGEEADHPLVAIVSPSFWNRHFPEKGFEGGMTAQIDSKIFQRLMATILGLARRGDSLGKQLSGHCQTEARGQPRTSAGSTHDHRHPSAAPISG